MKKLFAFGSVLLMAAVMSLPASAAMWVGGELGANFIGSTDMTVNQSSPGFSESTRFKNASIDPSVIGGLTLGYDFVNTGFAGYAYPEWMKYFGVAVDYTYNRTVISSQTRSITTTRSGEDDDENGTTRRFLVAGSKSNGYVSALTFLFYGHYGFFPDSEVPAGRLHPYIGVGPAVVWTGIDLGSEGLGSKTSTNVALVAETGIRFMALKNVSLDVAFRYRYFTPSWDFSTPFGTAKLDTTINSYSVLTRVAYHF